VIEDAYPLCWPLGVPRTPASQRRRAVFKSATSRITVERAIRRLLNEATTGRWHVEKLIVSTNIPVRKSDGLPYSAVEPADPGVACYFTLDGERRCIPSDKWDRVADNIAGIAAAIGALRGLERWVNDANVRAAFRGFAALPDPNAVDWRAVFGLRNGEVTREAVIAAFRRLSIERHPDHGGSDALQAELNRARDQALKELSG
jgi:hypothetical protein